MTNLCKGLNTCRTALDSHVRISAMKRKYEEMDDETGSDTDAETETETETEDENY